ncbi:hypothetical protein GCM10009850_099540 [Nonomuraea monospora]|uniref:AAA+ ATPase domain-containing protein n=1 Tax=Nonomuraea monospora TaxID=568818 RepID=A0ABN3CZ07_9ACTN
MSEAVQIGINGDNNGTVLVGDNNIVHYTDERTIVTQREGGPVPVRRRERPDPRFLPQSAASLIGRERDLARVRGWLAERGAPVLVYGPPGIGKSAVLSKVARDAADAGEDVVYLSGAGLETEDIVQELFEACYDSPGYLPPPKRLRQLMGKVRALVVIDGYEGTAESLERLLDATPGAGLLLASTQRLLGAEGHVLPLGGLTEADAVTLTTTAALADRTGAAAVADRNGAGEGAGWAGGEVSGSWTGGEAVADRTGAGEGAGWAGGEVSGSRAGGEAGGGWASGEAASAPAAAEAVPAAGRAGVVPAAGGAGVVSAAGGAGVVSAAGGGLSGEERAAIRELCRAANGHPRTLLQAAALMRTNGVLPVAADPGTAARALVASLDGDRSAAARALAALPGVPVSAPVLAALAALPSPDDADAALTELRRLRLAEPAGPGHRLAGEAPIRRGRRDAAGYATRLTAWVRSATRAEVAASAAVIVAVLRAAVQEEAHDPARTLARAAAPLLGRSLRWGAWGRTLALGLTAATNAGAADDVAYFESEKKVRERALGLLLGLGGGGLGAAGALAFFGKGGSLFSAPTLAIAVTTTVVVTAATAIGVHLARPSAAEQPATVITPVAAGPRSSGNARPPLGTADPPLGTADPPLGTADPPVESGNRPSPGTGPGTIRRTPPDTGPDTRPDTGSDTGRRTSPDPGPDRRPPPDTEDNTPRDRSTPRPATPHLTLSNPVVESGGSTDARATGFDPGERITFSWTGQGGSGDLGTRTADSRGIAVLPGATVQAAGAYTITAQGKTPERRAEAGLTVRERPAPPIRLTSVPSSVRAEAALEVTATGFEAGETVRLTLGDTLVATATAGGNGHVTLRGHAPAQPATYRLTVTGRAAGRSAGTELTVTPKPPPDLSGNWGGYLNFQDVGGGSYEGTRRGSDHVEPNSGCTFPHGGAEVHLSGNGPVYEGETRWVHGSSGQNCDFKWGAATFTLSADGDSLEVISQNPFVPGETKTYTLQRN